MNRLVQDKLEKISLLVLIFFTEKILHGQNRSPTAGILCIRFTTPSPFESGAKIIFMSVYAPFTNTKVDQKFSYKMGFSPR